MLLVSYLPWIALDFSGHSYFASCTLEMLMLVLVLAIHNFGSFLLNMIVAWYL